MRNELELQKAILKKLMDTHSIPQKVYKERLERLDSYKKALQNQQKHKEDLINQTKQRILEYNR
ncbi:hypothetical protein ACFCVS_08545 [Bacillus altitudinis]|uniref:Uncharacterized protein n=1 Tax=Bacillus altitudinis TaxID=293387 RepID=A0A653TDB6_BACAB|nr:MULTISPECIES: hypothetical protein [Bacillus]MBI1628910.1 hypothetical protein [Bacillus safensis]VXB79314.1 hypothetical protein BACI348_41565 [Bacillus altitudinis]